MAEPLERVSEDPDDGVLGLLEGWCEDCEQLHDHVLWLAERAAMVNAWSESARDLEAAAGVPRAVLCSVEARKLGAVDGDEEAVALCRKISRLVASLRRITDAAAWRAQREAAEAAPETPRWCGHCGSRITLLGGTWTDGDGTAACTDTSAPYVPHKPEED